MIKYYIAIGSIGCRTLMNFEKQSASELTTSFIYIDTDPVTETQVPANRFLRVTNFSKDFAGIMELGKSVMCMDCISDLNKFFNISDGEYSIEITYVTSSFGCFGAGSVLEIDDYVKNIINRKTLGSVNISSRIIAISHEFFEGSFSPEEYSIYQSNTETLKQNYINGKDLSTKLFIVFAPEYKNHMSAILSLTNSELDAINTFANRDYMNSINQTAYNKICYPYKGQAPYIFVSYSNKNVVDAIQIISHLQNEGYRVWYDEGIDPGTEWDENIATHIETCYVFIALFSNEYVNSSNCKDELSYAIDLGKKRLLIYLHDSVNMPAGMGMRTQRLQNIHKYRYPDDKSFYEKLKETDGLNECLEKAPAKGNEINLSPISSDSKNGNPDERFSKLYTLLVDYRESLRNGDANAINKNTSELQLVLNEMYLWAERYQYSRKETADAIVSLVNQFNRYAKIYNAYAASADRMSEEAQNYAKQAEKELKELINMVVKLLPR